MVLQGAPDFGGDAAPCARDNCLKRDLPQRAANSAAPLFNAVQNFLEEKLNGGRS